MALPAPRFTLPAVLSLLGLRPVYVDELGMDALLLGRWGLVLIDAGLGSDSLTQLGDQLLSQVTLCPGPLPV